MSNLVIVPSKKEEIQSILNKDIKALIACSGGDYLIQILDLINFETINLHFKNCVI